MDKKLIKQILREARTNREQLPSQQELANFLANYFPEETPEQKMFNDHWGLYSKNPEGDVKKILLCTTPTTEIINYAKKNGYDLLISHHDMLFSDAQMPQIIYHSSMDLNQKGHNIYFYKKMGLKNFRKKHDVAIEGDLYKPMLIDEFTKYLSNHGFQVNGVVWENPNFEDKQIQHVLYCSGGGGMLLGPNHIIDLSNVPADVYVTGELYSTPNNNKFKYIVELGHTSSEKPIFKWVKTRLQNRWKNLEIDLAPDEIDYYGSDNLKNKQDKQAIWDKEREERYKEYGPSNFEYGDDDFNGEWYGGLGNDLEERIIELPSILYDGGVPEDVINSLLPTLEDIIANKNQDDVDQLLDVLYSYIELDFYRELDDLLQEYINLSENN